MNPQVSIRKYLVGVFLSGYCLFLFFPKSIAIAAPDIDNVTIEQISQWHKQNVIYLGENHDCPEHHVTQLQIIMELYQAKAETKLSLAIALEMFQRPFQPILDRYLAKEINEAELREQTEYNQRWGWDWEFYAPILRFAQVLSLIHI